MWRRRAAAWLAAAAVCLAAAGPALGSPADYVGRRIASVRIQVEGASQDDPQLLDLVETRVGQPLSMSDVRESVTHLFSLGRFEDVQVEALAAEAGVALIYNLIPLHGVRELVFQGSLGLSERRLRGAVNERYGPAPPAGRAADVATTLKNLYEDAGYLQAQVTAGRRVQHAPDRTILVFDISAGPRARIGRVDVRGEPLDAPARVLDDLDLEPGGYYEPAKLEERMADRAKDLVEKGYYQALVTHTRQMRDDGALVDLTVDVRPGPHVEVRFEGDRLPRDVIADLVPVEREASADEDLLEDSVQRVKDYLQGQGYADADASYRRQLDDEQLAITFTVRKGRLVRLADVELMGNSALPPAEARALVAAEAGQPFVRARLEAGAAALLEHYRRLGFDEAAVEVSIPAIPPAAGARDERVAEVTPRIVITEGVRTRVGSVTLRGHASMPEGNLRGVMILAPGKPFYRPHLAADRDAIRLLYLNRGFEEVDVTIEPRLGPDRTYADLLVDIREGRQILVDRILIVGNTRVRPRTIRREIVLEEGQPLGLADLIETQRRLSALGLFRRVRVTEIRHGNDARRDVLVLVEEAPATSVGYGGGLEAGRRLRRGPDALAPAEERIELAPRGFFEVGRRNLWGKNRSINLFTRVSLRPRDAPDPEEDSGFGFNEYRVIATFREPRAFGMQADALVTGFLEQAIRPSFNFKRRGANAQLTRRLGPAFAVSGAYRYNQTELFDERFADADKPLIDRLFPQVTLSAFSSVWLRDTRDDPLDSTRGTFTSVEGELAARRMGSEVGFAKTFMQGFLFQTLPGARRAVVAIGARLGMVSGFPRDVIGLDPSGQPVIGPHGQPIVETLRDVPASERFFAGGDTTVRGYSLDRLGAADTIDPNGFPKGGHALVVFNAEVRVPVWRDFGVAGFVDAGNVFAGVDDLDLGNIRGAVGFGLRYRSPVGPVRVDVGFKLDRRVIAGRKEALVAPHISIGQAF